jgi:hypothetical protein
VIRTGLSFTYELVPGAVMLRTDGRGCPLYRVGAGDLRRAYDDSATGAGAPADWNRAMAEAIGLEPTPE